MALAQRLTTYLHSTQRARLPATPHSRIADHQRLARTQARSEGFGQHVATSPPSAASSWPAELHRMNMELTALRLNPAEALGLGSGRVAPAPGATAAQLQLRAWQPALMERFGPEVGTKLSQHQVEVGMTLDMVLASMGTLTQVQDLSANGPNLYLRYGGVEMGSLTECITVS